MATDFISNLPLGITGIILSRLPINEAVRTSILASDWRFKWRAMTDLYFDNGLSETSVEYGRIVNRILLLHEGHIRKFSLNSMLDLGTEIDPWIFFLSRHGIEELNVFCGRLRGFRFPSSLFDCNKLTNLELYYCKLDVPPTFQGFVELKRLSLSLMDVDCSIERLISRSRKLEILSLILLHIPDQGIRISAPKVNYLELRCRLKDVYLVDLQSLVHMVFGLDDRILNPIYHNCNRSLIDVFGGAPNLETLTFQSFDTKYFKVGYHPGASSASFKHLKLMHQHFSLWEADAVFGFLELLLSAPNIEKVVLIPKRSTLTSLPIEVRKVYAEFWLNYPDKCDGFKKLKTIEMIDIYDTPAEVEFAKFMLCNSPVLETMKVTCPDSFMSDKSQAINILLQYFMLPRASAQAKITFYQRRKNNTASDCC